MSLQEACHFLRRHTYQLQLFGAPLSDPLRLAFVGLEVQEVAVFQSEGGTRDVHFDLTTVDARQLTWGVGTPVFLRGLTFYIKAGSHLHFVTDAKKEAEFLTALNLTLQAFLRHHKHPWFDEEKFQSASQAIVPLDV